MHIYKFNQRQFNDSQIKAIIERKGVIGAVLDASMLKTGWLVGTTSNSDIRLENVVDHIDYICQLAGNSCHAAIGSDLDGGFGWEQSPFDIETIDEMQKITKILNNRGYDENDISNILAMNWINLVENSWEKKSLEK